MMGAKIKELRTARGMTQHGLAKAANLDEMAVSRIELGKREPLESTIRAIARALGVAPGLLFDPPELPMPEVRAGRPPRTKAKEPVKEKRSRGRPRKTS